MKIDDTWKHGEGRDLNYCTLKSPWKHSAVGKINMTLASRGRNRKSGVGEGKGLEWVVWRRWRQGIRWWCGEVVWCGVQRVVLGNGGTRQSCKRTWHHQLKWRPAAQVIAKVVVLYVAHIPCAREISETLSPKILLLYAHPCLCSYDQGISESVIELESSFIFI